MHTKNQVDENISNLAKLFPNVITEKIKCDEYGNAIKDDQGNTIVNQVVDFDLLRQELSYKLVDGGVERYRLDWPGKREAILTANSPVAKTLRPYRQESINFDSTKNIFIEGDNLDALKLLQENYLGKIKLIYIDPPYNTGNDFIYEDDFAESTDDFFQKSKQFDEEGNRLIANTESNGRFHSDWLSMIYSRLKLARNLLKDDGLIFINIDDGEVANLRKICDEIFGEKNFIAQIAWEKRYTRSNNAKRFYSLKDNIIVFRKSDKLDIIKENRSEKADSNYKNPDNDPRGPWATSSYVNPAVKEARPNLVYGIINPYTGIEVFHPTHAWKFGLAEHKKHIEENRLWWGRDGNAEYPRLKIYLNEQNSGMVPIDLWDYKSSGTTDDGGAELKALFGKAVFDTPKPTKLLEKILGIATTRNEEHIVLDFFAGSSTTAHAVLNMNLRDNGNRRFIMVQLPELFNEKSNSVSLNENFLNISDLSKERIRRAGKKIVEENLDKEGIDYLDIGFRSLKIDSTNMKDVYYTPDALKQADMLDLASNIKEERTSEDLLFQVMLDWGLELSLPIERKTLDGKEVFYVAGDSLVACFDELTFDLVDEVAKDHPLRFVSAEKAIHHDHDKTNIKERFKQLSPDTEVKFL